MDRLRFRDVMHTTFDCTDDVMLDRIFRFFDANNDAQASKLNLLSLYNYYNPKYIRVDVK